MVQRRFQNDVGESAVSFIVLVSHTVGYIPGLACRYVTCLAQGRPWSSAHNHLWRVFKYYLSGTGSTIVTLQLF